MPHAREGASNATVVGGASSVGGLSSSAEMKRLAKTLVVLVLAGSASLDADGWTDRLGLRFKDDCQEHAKAQTERPHGRR